MLLSKEEQFKSREQRRLEVACDGVERITLSFYKYVNVSDPQAMRDFLFEHLYSMGCLGRIYVASEGINAHMNVPQDKWEEVDVCIHGIEELAGVPYTIAADQYKPSLFKVQ